MLWVLLFTGLLAASELSGSPEAAADQMQAAIQAQKSGDFPTAISRYRSLLAIHPQLTTAHHLLGICELQLGHLREGIQELEIVRKQDPANHAASYTLVSTYITAGMPEAAKVVLDTSLRSDTSPAAKFMRGSYRMAVGEHADAIQELQKARALDPKLPGLLSQLGVAYCFANQLDKAIPALEGALRENPGDTNAAAFLGWLYKDQDRDSEATALLEKTIVARPTDKGAYFLLAQLAQSRGEQKRALELLEKVVAMDPGFRPAHVLLARIYLQAGRASEAAREREIVTKLTDELQAAQPKPR